MPGMDQLAETYAKINEVLKDPKVLDALSLTDKKALQEWLAEAKYNWELNADTKQKVPPGQWSTWLLLAGRGFGKTRVGAETVRQMVNHNGYRAVGLIAPTAADAREVMVDGKGGSSLLEITPQREGLEYFPTKRRLVWGNGAKGSTFSAEEPSRLRGPQNDLIWSDELAAWRYLQETWDMAMFGLRLGQNPRHIITTTPRPLSIIKDLVKDAVPASEMRDGMVEDVVVTRGSTMDNARNLSPNFIRDLMKKYEGTRLGRQELYAEILDDNPNALFKQSNIDMARVDHIGGLLRGRHEITFEYRLARGSDGPNTFKVVLREITVAVDPAMSSDADSDETGIMVMGRDDRNHIYVLQDETGIHTPNEWARLVINLYRQYGADSIVAEVNQGGDLVEHTIRTVEKEMGIESVKYKKVRASKGKHSRAEPVGALEEQGRLHHVGDFPKLEDQLTSFAPAYEKSPDRVDAYVWGAHQLVVQKENRSFFIS